MKKSRSWCLVRGFMFPDCSGDVLVCNISEEGFGGSGFWDYRTRLQGFSAFGIQGFGLTCQGLGEL